MDEKSVLEEIVGRWDDHGHVRAGAYQITLLGARRYEAHVVVGDGVAELREGVHPSPIGTLSMPHALLVQCMEQGEIFDPRLLPVDAQRTITFAGDPSFVTALMYLLRKPSADAVRRIRASERLARARRPLAEIARVHKPTIAAVVDALRSSTPMIVTGALESWQIQRWTFERLVTEHGHARFVNGGPAATLGEFVDAVIHATDVSAYSNGCGLPAELAAVFEPPFFARDTFIPQLGMGIAVGRAAATRLHRDLTDALLAQVIGKKRVQYFSPDQAPLLYPFKNFNSHQQCWVEPWAPDLARFPLFASAAPIEIVLEPGELLVNPAGWFHCVYANEPTMSVSFAVRGDSVHSPDA